jgi:hypothetical protein
VAKLGSLTNGSSTVVEHSNRDLEIEGSNLATDEKWRRKSWIKLDNPQNIGLG